MKHTDIAAQRLHNQRLLQTDFERPDQVVSWLGAVQSQDYAGAKWAIGLRTNGLTESDVDRAFADGSILRTHLLRPTWHFVTPEDIRSMLALTGPRVHQANAFMYRKLELDAATLKRSRSVLEKTLRGNRQLTRPELVSALNQAGISTDDTLRGTYLIMHAELEGLICSGPRRGKQFTYGLLEERAPRFKETALEAALAELVIRYFQSHGPATLHDFCIWSGLTMADARKGMESVKSQFESEQIDGQTYWFKESNRLPKMKSPRAHLLPNYDEYFIGFKDRGAILKHIRKSNIQKDDPALLSNILTLDGQVVGGWRRELKKNEVIVEASLITTLTKTDKHAITQAAERFAEFLALPLSFRFKDFDHGQRKTRSF